MPMMSVEVAAAASAYYLALLLKSRKGKKKRKTWVRKFLENGSAHGNLLLKDLRLDGAGFINFVCMSTSDFEILITSHNIEDHWSNSINCKSFFC